jgi:hypothetical protein
LQPGQKQLTKKCYEFGIYKNNTEYLKRQELDQMMAGGRIPVGQGFGENKMNAEIGSGIH